MLMLVVATLRDHEQPAFKCQKVVKKLHRMWNWDDIKKRLASGRVAATSEQHRFKLNRCECDFTDLKKMQSFIIRAFSESLILVYPILLPYRSRIIKNGSGRMKRPPLAKNSIAEEVQFLPSSIPLCFCVHIPAPCWYLIKCRIFLIVQRCGNYCIKQYIWEFELKKKFR